MGASVSEFYQNYTELKTLELKRANENIRMDGKKNHSKKHERKIGGWKGGKRERLTAAL